MALLQNSSLLQATLDPMGTTEATLRMENVDVKDEWQDEGLPRYKSPGLCVSCGGSGPSASPRWGAGELPVDQARPTMNICYII